MAKATPKPSIKEKAVRAALKLAARDGWARVTLQAVAAEAKVSLAALHEHFEDRHDLLTAYGRMIDRRVLDKAGKPDGKAPPRDRLFDLLMERFDVLNEDRAGVVVILKSLKCDPKQAAIALPHLGRSMSWMLEAAGIETGGWQGVVKILGLTALYLDTLRHWAADDTEDMSRTMAALDRNLGRAEQWAGRARLS